MKNKKKSNAQAVRFGREAAILASAVSGSDFGSILKLSMRESFSVMYASKKRGFIFAVKTAASICGKTAGAAVNEVRHLTGSPSSYIRTLGPRIGHGFRTGNGALRQYTSSKMKIFRSLDFSDKRKFITDGAVFLATTLLVGGGTDFEGGAPDLDIAIFGIGGHRNILTHSILWGFGLEFLVRVLVRLYRKGATQLPAERSHFWKRFDDLAGLLARHEGALVSGIWAGMAIHLLQDAALTSSATKPYVGLPGAHSMATHQALYAGNSFLSFMFSAEDFPGE